MPIKSFKGLNFNLGSSIAYLLNINGAINLKSLRNTGLGGNYSWDWQVSEWVTGDGKMPKIFRTGKNYINYLIL